MDHLTDIRYLARLRPPCLPSSSGGTAVGRGGSARRRVPQSYEETEVGVKPLEPLDRPRPLHLSVQDAIRTYILENRLSSGDGLPPEGELARQLGVSRSSVREAVKALESVGLLRSQRGNGVFVADFTFDPLLANLHYGLVADLDELAEMLHVRRVLEVGMLGEAIERITTDELDQLEVVVDQMGRAAERGEHARELDREFHRLLFTSTGNATLLKLVDIFWRAFRMARDLTDLPPPDPTHVFEMHREILDAVRAGDHPAATEALERHYADSMILRQHEREDEA